MQRKFKWDEIKVIVGLGNPGKEFEGTFHNAGQTVLRAFLRNADAKNFSAMPRAHFSFARHAGRAFAIPSSFMNESGGAVKEALRAFHATPEELLVLHDDTDLTLGTSRLAFGRGAAGHHGAESVIKALGTKNFWRLRIGVRPSGERRSPPSPSGLRRIKAGDFVLRHMAAHERAALEAVAESFSCTMNPAAPRDGKISDQRSAPRR